MTFPLHFKSTPKTSPSDRSRSKHFPPLYREAFNSNMKPTTAEKRSLIYAFFKIHSQASTRFCLVCSSIFLRAGERRIIKNSCEKIMANDVFLGGKKSFQRDVFFLSGRKIRCCGENIDFSSAQREKNLSL